MNCTGQLAVRIPAAQSALLEIDSATVFRKEIG